MKNPLTYLSRTWERGKNYNAAKGVAAPAGGDCEAKSAGYQRKCKIFFCWTGKIQYQFVHSPNFKKVLAGAPRGAMHDNATSAVDRSLNPFCCSRTHPPIPLWALQLLLADSDFIQSQKRAKLAPTLLWYYAAAISGCTHCTIKAAGCHKNSIHCFKPFPTARILHGISTVVRFNNFRRLTLFAVLPKPMPLKRLKLVLKSR